MENYHVPFWRAVEGATSSLTLIADFPSSPIFVRPQSHPEPSVRIETKTAHVPLIALESKLISSYSPLGFFTPKCFSIRPNLVAL
jgi:hypothetical protein